MVFNGILIIAVASWSSEACQYVSCNPERFTSREIFDLLCRFPLQQIGRIALCVCSFLCSPNPQFFLDSSSSSSEDESDSDDGGYYYDSHSD